MRNFNLMEDHIFPTNDASPRMNMQSELKVAIICQVRL